VLKDVDLCCWSISAVSRLDELLSWSKSILSPAEQENGKSEKGRKWLVSPYSTFRIAPANSLTVHSGYGGRRETIAVAAGRKRARKEERKG
jgi:hypothetical protein